MAYQTLYRKYRPKSFELVFGQDVVVKTLKNIIKNNKLSHAYLFTGPRGTGKTSCAKLFAKTINCLNNKNGDACNECENCKIFNENGNPDIIEIDAASNNGVDEIREIRNKVNLVPSMSKYKVYIIDEVHMLSIGAFNALLKTLEEPPEHIIFILATTEPQKIPATIISRCQRFDFKSIDKNKMKECLENIIKKENIDIESDALQEIINNSNGGMRDAIGLLDQSSSFCENKITANDIEELSGNISNDEIYNLLKSIINKEYKTIFDKITNYSESGKDFSLICEKLINYIRKGILFKKGIETEKLNENDKQIYNSLTSENIYFMIDFLSETLTKLKNNYQKELTFEVQIIQLIDKLTNNVSCETLFDEKKINTDVSRETSRNKENNTNVEINNKINNNVSRETLIEEKIKKDDVSREISNINNKLINELKDIRINNILKEATKKNINYIIELWDKINDYLIEDKYKLVAGMLNDAKPVAASNNGVIITLPLDSTVNRIEKYYDDSKELLKEMYDEYYKIVYISDDYWKKVRPIYVEKIKNNELKLINEEDVLKEIKNNNNNNSMNEFNELIEMEDE